MFSKNLLFGIAILLVLVSCDKKEEQLPAYINIQPFTLESNIEQPFNVGSLSQDISHVEVFISDVNNPLEQSDYLGHLSLPASVPYLGSGEKIIRLSPVIKANGNSFSLRTYPFYESATIQTTVTELEEAVLNPVVTYKSSDFFQVHFNETFNGDDHIFTDYKTNSNGTTLENSSTDAFEGARSGEIILNKDNPIIEVRTGLIYNAKNISNPFIELNYKSDVQFNAGIVGTGVGGEEFSFFQFDISEEWDKIYLELFDQVGFLADEGADNYQIVITAILPTVSGEFIDETRTIRIDNFKFLSLK